MARVGEEEGRGDEGWKAARGHLVGRGYHLGEQRFSRRMQPMSVQLGKVTNRDCEVVENTRSSVKKLPNSLIISNNHELNSIVVNKGRIHKELR